MERRDTTAMVALIFGKKALQRHLMLKHPGAIERARRALLLYDRRRARAASRDGGARVSRGTLG